MIERKLGGFARLRPRMRTRLTLGAAVLLGAISLFIYLYFPGKLERQALQATYTRAQSIAAMTAHTVSAPLFFEDTTDIGAAFQSALRNDDVRYLVVTNEGRRTVRAENAFAADVARFREAGQGSVSPDGSLYRARAEVRNGDRLIGLVFVGLSLDQLHADVQRARFHVAMVSLAVFVIGVLGVFALTTFLTHPLRRIVRTVDRVSAGDLSQRTEVSSADEIGYLGRSFDTMVARLEAAYGALQSANRDLERRVGDRTHELRREIEERARAEVALRESEQRFRAMFESAAVGMALLGPDGRVLAANPALYSMLGRAPDELRGRAAANFVHPDDAPCLRALEDLCTGGRDGFQLEARYQRADGSALWGRTVASAIRQQDGALQFGLVMIEDVTDRRELGERLRQSQKLEAVGRLAGGIAHDFNNLLTTIKGLAEMLLAEHGAVPRLGDDLQEILKAGDRATALTGQLLAFSRRQVVQPQVLDPNASIRDMAAMLERLIGSDISLTLDLADDIHSVRADPGQVGQIIMNLAVNARDAMPRGGSLTLETRNLLLSAAEATRVGAREEGHYVQVVVRDTGHGMDEEIRERIFEPFFTTKEQGRGTGLGLATVYGIMQQSGGGIAVDTAPDAGTTFTLYFPSLGRFVPPEARAPEAGAGGGSDTILVVEDEDAVRSLVGRILRKAGYTVLESSNGEEALDAFRENQDQIQAVVTDVIMPRMSGPELARKLADLVPDLPILYMSGYTQDEVLDVGLSREGTAFIQKPMSPVTLTRKIRELLDSRPARAG
jgi:PAS domain S-box-containing protein